MKCLLLLSLCSFIYSCNETCFTYCFKYQTTTEYTTLFNITTTTRTKTVTESIDLDESLSTQSSPTSSVNTALDNLLLFPVLSGFGPESTSSYSTTVDGCDEKTPTSKVFLPTL